MSEEYFLYKLEREQKTDWFSPIIKILVILVLFLVIIVLGIWGYKLITKDDSMQVRNYMPQPKPQVQKVIVREPVVVQKPALKKEEIALIIKTVLEQMQQNQQFIVKNQKNAAKKSEDRELLSSLQNIKVDSTKETKPKIKEKNLQKLANKKIKRKPKEKIIKKEIVYNAVIINKKEVKSIDDLAKLYASINKIAKSKKRKILNSAYTKKIKKEIIIRKNAMRTIKVRPGDTLSSIAQRAYGKSSMYKKIFEANPDLLSNPHKLKVGMILRVPK